MTTTRELLAAVEPGFNAFADALRDTFGPVTLDYLAIRTPGGEVIRRGMPPLLEAKRARLVVDDGEGAKDDADFERFERERAAMRAEAKRRKVGKR